MDALTDFEWFLQCSLDIPFKRRTPVSRTTDFLESKWPYRFNCFSACLDSGLPDTDWAMHLCSAIALLILCLQGRLISTQLFFTRCHFCSPLVQSSWTPQSFRPALILFFHVKQLSYDGSVCMIYTRHGIVKVHLFMWGLGLKNLTWNREMGIHNRNSGKWSSNEHSKKLCCADSIYA